MRMGMHPWFERITMAMIFLNAVWISVDIEFNDADILAEADAGFIVVENLFCSFFTCELILRYAMFTKTWYAVQDVWFMWPGRSSIYGTALGPPYPPSDGHGSPAPPLWGGWCGGGWV